MPRQHHSPNSSMIGCLVALVVTLACPTTSRGQGQDQQAGGLEIAELKGLLLAVSGDRIKLMVESGDEIIAVLNRQSSLKFEGTADVSFLGPGQLVRFTADFNPVTGVPTQAIKKLEIFRPARQRRMSRQQREDQTAGIYPVAAEENEKQAAPSGSTRFKIVGQLRGVQGNMAQVVAGRRPIMIQLDPMAEVTVASGDTMFCVAGDSISITGLQNAAQPGFVQAETVEIKAAKPLKAANPNSRNSGRSGLNRRKQNDQGLDTNSKKDGNEDQKQQDKKPL